MIVIDVSEPEDSSILAVNIAGEMIGQVQQMLMEVGVAVEADAVTSAFVNVMREASRVSFNPFGSTASLARDITVLCESEQQAGQVQYDCDSAAAFLREFPSVHFMLLINM